MLTHIYSDHKRYVRNVLCLAAVIAAALVLCGCVKKSDGQIKSISELGKKGTSIAVSTNTPEAKLVPEDFPDAKIRSYSDIYLAYQEVASGKVTAAIYQRRQMELAIENGVKGVVLLDDNYCDNTVGIGISRKTNIPDFKNKLNEFLREAKDDGTLDDMYDRWVVKNNREMPDIPEAEDTDLTLKVATTGTVEPYSYYIGTELTGYDIELAKRFAAWLGANLEFKVYDWGGLISAAQGGDADCIMSDLYYRPEYEESIDFSDPLFTTEVTAMVRDAGSNAGGSVWSSLKDGFTKTFITEDRWRLFIYGAVTTLIITLFSVAAGILIGFVVFMACRHGNRAALKLTGFSIRLVQGMPVVVLLMVLYYLVFGTVQISGVVVSIIAFSLLFGSEVYERMKAGVSAIDPGQTDAAFSLGYTDRETFFKLILPQAMPFIIPPVKGDMIALLKATAVVGYIAVQDLTKMADIVRSRTYDAFFPIISVAVIYFILEGVMLFVMDRIEPRFDPKKRKPENILKGVKR